MNIVITWHDSKYPSFNVGLASKEGADPFLEIKGCRIVDGQKGPFVSYPSRKQDDGKYWNHVWGSQKFNDVVLAKAQEAMPRASTKRSGAEVSSDDDIPFANPYRRTWV